MCTWKCQTIETLGRCCRRPLSLSRQCCFLSIVRPSLHYEPKGERLEALALIRRIDELFLKYPINGARRMAFHLRHRVPRTGDSHPEHRV